MANTVKMAFGAAKGAGTPGGPVGTTNITNVNVSATTLPPGSTATAAASLTEERLTMVFGLPQGATGNIGPTGPQGETGNGIASVELISGTHAPGTTDTYKITFTDGSGTTFSVYNGADGAGAGDMTKAVYDKKTLGLDIFGYADGMLGKTTTFNADGSITETTTAWSKLTTFNADGSITERISYADDSWRQKTTTFNADGSITETITEGTA